MAQSMGKQPRRGGRQQFSEPGCEEEVARSGGKPSRQLNSQNSNVGMLPPNSDDEDEDEQQLPKPGDMPPNSDDEDDEDQSPPKVELTRREREQLEAQKEEEPDPEQVAKDMERLALVKKRREEQKQKRIDAEGWDRMAPLSETNHPPGTTYPPPS